MIIVRKEEEEEFTTFMDVVGCTVYKSSLENIQEMRERHTDKEIIENDTDDIGLAAGQVVLDKVIEVTKDMSREDLVRWLAQCSAQVMIKTMNDNPKYREKIIFLCQFL